MDNPEGSRNKLHDESTNAPIITPSPVEPGRRTQLPTEPDVEVPAPVSVRPDTPPAIPPGASDEALRPSVLDALRQSRTTWLEVGKVAERLSRVGLGLEHARAIVRQAVISFALALTLVLTLAVVFAGGTLRLVLGILAGTFAMALAVFGALRFVSKLAERRGARTLPGSPWLWVGGVVVVAAAGTLAVGLSLWEVSKVATARRTALITKPATSADGERIGKRADRDMKRGIHIGLERGVLYAPPKFESADGQFDLIIHFHGNTDLVEQSLVASKLNAMIAIINVGDGAGVYSKALQNPYVFDRMLTTIEHRAETQLRLKRPQIRRIALSAWSAGFASVGQILSSRSRLDRIDAVLLEDSPHAKYAPFAEPEVYVPSLENYLAFARRAMAGRKLMVITHSAIQTEGYPSTTRTVDALIKQLGLARTTVAPASASPPPVDIPVAKRAFPDGERNWLQVVSEVHKESFYVYGCTGNGKGDHIAHLAQMSATVLPPLKERWQ